jgi:hypothetical protein
MINKTKLIFTTLTTLLFLYINTVTGQNSSKWIRPISDSISIPIWGHQQGIRVGIAPTPGPRGLLRIFTPYLGHKEDKVFNFIALEPISKGSTERGFSELEMSQLDNVRGKRFWSSNDSICKDSPSLLQHSSGIVENIDGIETLTLYIFSETFENGAKPFVRLRFYEDSIYEFELSTYKCSDSVPLENFILTATMGNYARLRNLYLNDTIKSSLKLWSDYNDNHFTQHDVTFVSQMIKDIKGGVYFIAAPDEKDPVNVKYDKSTRINWKYYGKKATQYWYSPNPNKNLTGLVNGRYTYWGGKAPIPGGVSFENFEFVTPFESGEIFIFGVTPLSPDAFIEQIN